VFEGEGEGKVKGRERDSEMVRFGVLIVMTVKSILCLLVSPFDPKDVGNGFVP
jgi:hypothetical protein